METTESPSFDSIELTTVEPQQELLNYIRENNLQQIETLYENGTVEFNYVYNFKPHYITPLSVASIKYKEQVTTECIKKLLECGANPLVKDKQEISCLDRAAASAKTELLEPILEHLKNNNYNFKENKTMLYLINYIDGTVLSKKNTEDYFSDVVKLLLKYIDINSVDNSDGETVIYKAANYDLKYMVQLIIDEKRNEINLEKFEGEDGKTARDIIIEKRMYDGELPQFSKNCGLSNIENLFKNLRNSEVTEFTENYNKIQNENTLSEENNNKLFHMSVENGLHECVEFLIKYGVDPNTVNFQSAVEKACSRGYYKILEILLKPEQNPDTKKVCKSLIAVTNYNGGNTKEHSKNVDYEKCLDILLAYKHIKVNYQDEITTKTALHLSAMYQPPEMTLKLLRRGASFACVDKFGVMPISDMNAETMKTHLDECIIESTQNLTYDDPKRFITIKVSSFLKPRSDTTDIENNENVENRDAERQSTTEHNEFLQEISVVERMSRMQELEQLLTHPVIMIFLYLKWYQIRLYSYFNLVIYSIFSLILWAYILLIRYNAQQTLTTVIFSLLCTAYILLVLREIFQMLVYRRHYIYNFENWLEIILLADVTVILSSTDKYVIKQASAMGTVFSAIELLLLIGQIPGISTNIIMLRTVTFTFLKLLLLYSVLLLAFAVSFFILFEPTSNKQNKDNGNEESDTDFFANPGTSLLKMVVMLTGEMDSSSLNFGQNPVVSDFMFFLFVFLMVIVVYNLLNGLAISDTQMIKCDAELYEQKLIIDQIALLENFLMNNNSFKRFPLMKRIHLFSTNDNDIKVFINKNYKLSYAANDENTNTNIISKYLFSNIYLDEKIQVALKTKLQDKYYSEKRRKKDKAIQRLEEQQQLMCKKLEKIETTLENYVN